MTRDPAPARPTAELGDAFAGLNEAQREAVAAVRGPVCILAGAGSGKTTTITRRIAYQVLSGAFAATNILAVTFTDKAATEMRTRLARLAVPGVRARTFHSAALAQLSHFRPGWVGKVMGAKGEVLGPIVRSLGRPYRFVPIADFASEIEWAKNQRITPDGYLSALDSHSPPVDAEVMHRVFRDYERRKSRAGAIDFEDMLERAIAMFEEDDRATRTVRERYLAFNVDEYQDVNLLQQTLLEQWLGPRRDLCVVGDDYQAIYSFTGASPKFLLEVPARYRDAHIVRLVTNYRSTPEILRVANHLVPRLGGSAKRLDPVQGAGPGPAIKRLPSPRSEREYIVDRIRELHSHGIPYEEIAILYRTNARAEDYEEALGDAHLPYQLRDDSLLARPAARQLLPRVARIKGTPVAEAVRATAEQLGYQPKPPVDTGPQEYVRQKDLARMVRMAEAVDDASSSVSDFVADIERRFARDQVGTGVHLMTLHRAKGLEFDAVFIPSLEKNELPHRRAAIDEERRLFYVGITRAKRWLHITWTSEGRNVSPFIGEIVRTPDRIARLRPTALAGAAPSDGEDMVSGLKAWRKERAASDHVPAFVVMHDSTLAEIARARPRSLGELRRIAGMGDVKCERYGPEILDVTARFRP